MIVSCPSCQRNYVVPDEQIAGKQFRARCKSCGVEFRLDGVQAGDASAASDKDEPAKFMSATEAFLALQSAPPPGTGTWSICLSKTDTRRMTTEEVVQAYNKGTFGTDVFVWKSGMQKWVRFSEVPELMAAIGKPLSKIPTNAAGSTDARPSAPQSEPPTRPGVSTFPAKGTKSSRPVRAATLMGTGAPLTPGASVPPRNGLNTPPPPPPEVMARASTRPQANGKQSEPQGSKAGASAVPRPSTVSSSPSPQSEKAAADKLIPKAPQVSAKSDPAASKAEGAARKPNTQSTALTPESLRPRKSAPAPVNRELEILVEVDVPPGTPAAAGSANGAVVLPPLKGAESQTAVSESIAAAGSLATTSQKSELPKAKVVEEKLEAKAASAQLGDRTASDVDSGSSGSEKNDAASVETAGSDIEANPAAGDSRSAGGGSSSGATETSLREAESSHKPAEPDKPAAEKDRESYPPLKSRKKTRVAGIVLSMAVVGLVGVVGGVAGAVYIMKGTTSPASPTSSVVALQPQPATPASVAPSVPEPAAAPVASAAAKPPETSAEESGNAEATTRHSSAHRNGSAPKVGIVAASKATPTNTQPAAAATPAPAATNPFNRESALAVLGFAASRAPTCKKPDGPKGAGRVQVTFDPTGAVVAASVVGAPIAGTPVAQCVASIFRKVRVPPFAGDRVTIPKDFTIPP